MPMPMYAAPPPPPPRRRGFPFILTACLLGFATLCAVAVTGAIAFAFLTVRVSASSAVSSQTGDLFLLHMAAGRFAEASRLVAPEYAGSVAALGEEQKPTWGENRGCRHIVTHSDVNFENGGFQELKRSSLEYSVKGTDGKTRVVRMRVLNGLIQEIAVDGASLLGEPEMSGRHGGSGCRIEAPLAPHRPSTTEAQPVESESDGSSRDSRQR